MNDKKFKQEVETLYEFIQYFCYKKHPSEKHKEHTFIDHRVEKHISLCEECFNLFFYSLEKLQHCPHEEKPRCRKCPNPCYEKQQWKQIAKIMRYGSLPLGFQKIKKRVFKQ